MTADSEKLIQELRLQSHPEGGFYRRSYQSEKIIETPHGKRYVGTAIYYLLEGKDFAAWHRIASDEIWHFYAGSSLTIYIIDKQGELKVFSLGNPLLHSDAVFQVVITGGQWFAAEVNDPLSFSLVGCTVSPGFDFQDWELGKREKLLEMFPGYSEMIERLSRK